MIFDIHRNVLFVIIIIIIYFVQKLYTWNTKKNCSKNRSGQCTWFPIPIFIFFFFSLAWWIYYFFSIIYPFDFDFCFYFFFFFASKIFILYFFFVFLLMCMKSLSGRNIVLYTNKEKYYCNYTLLKPCFGNVCNFNGSLIQGWI